MTVAFTEAVFAGFSGVKIDSEGASNVTLMTVMSGTVSWLVAVQLSVQGESVKPTVSQGEIRQ
jgi:hypothetical protein